LGKAKLEMLALKDPADNLKSPDQAFGGGHIGQLLFFRRNNNFFYGYNVEGMEFWETEITAVILQA